MEQIASTSAVELDCVCTVGKLSNSSCKNFTLTKDKNIFVIFEELSKEDLETLTWRTNGQYNEEDTICSHHFCYFLKYFEKNQKTCCDPFSKHTIPITKKKDLRIITLQKAKDVKEIKSIALVPGKLLCSTCRKELNRTSQEELNCEEIALIQNSDEETAEELNKVKRIIEKDVLNESLAGLDVTPLKLQSLSTHSKQSYAKKKFKQTKNQVKKKLSYVLQVDSPGDSSSESEDTQNQKEIKQKSEDLDYLVQVMKAKLKTNITRRDKIQVLTIAPKSWSRRKVAEKLDVSEYLVRKARTLSSEKGILAIPEPKHGRKLSEETVVAVHQFYEDDEFSYMLPGAKDRVSIQKNVYMQKRLLLCNLEELFIAFKQKHPNFKIGFSKFCSLRPKWVVLAGSPGTHCVCVCLYHQNVELLANAINQHDKESVHKMMEKLVCNRQSRNCMLRRCEECPKSNEQLKLYLEEILEDFDDEEEVKFSQWVSDGRMKLQTMLLPRQEFIDFMIEKIESLIPHSFITKAQNLYMKERKENLPIDEAIVLMDFAENYNFVLQNEVQSYHWSHLSCSVHPVVIYSRSEGESTKETSLCFISDDLKHDVPFVYSTQEKTTEFIKSNFPNITKIEYFTDGCSAQYKNFKSMVNLCYHKKDFQLKASWSFHATSHGKTVCDGIGGTVKRTVTKKNLQSPRESDQILTAEQMYSFCTSLFSKISFFFLKAENIEKTREIQEKRFESGHTLTGTRSFHFFQPLSHEEITAKRLSSDTEVSLKENIFYNALPSVKPNIHSFIACVYDNHWWLGMVEHFNEDEGDYDITFMHPHGPAETFFWPQKEDKCPVPAAHLLCIVKPPETTSQLGRSYKIESVSRKEIHRMWKIFHEKL